MSRTNNPSPSESELHAVEEVMQLLGDIYQPLSGQAATPPASTDANAVVGRLSLRGVRTRRDIVAPAEAPMASGSQPSMHDALASLGMLVALRSRGEGTLAGQETRAFEVLQAVVQHYINAQSGAPAEPKSVSEFFKSASDHIQRLGSLLPGRAATDAEDVGPTLFE